MREALYNSNKWKLEYRITASSPDLHRYRCILFQTLKPGDVKLLLGSWAKAFSLQQAEIGHQHPLAGMWQYYKGFECVHGVYAMERGNDLLRYVCRIRAEQHPYHVLLGNSLLLLFGHIAISPAGARHLPL